MMNPLLIHTLLKKWGLLLSVPLGLMLLPASQASGFRQPENITGDDITVGAPHMSQNPGGQMLWVDGRLVLVYWEGDGSVSQEYPSHIMQRFWTPTDGWTAAGRIDQGLNGQGEDIGGRHPTMIRRDDGGLFTVWNDYRHCTADRSWINNVEIYGYLQPGGDAPPLEQRLTQTLTESSGDNGFVPRLARLSDGRFVLVWYDFHFTIGELFLNISDAQGNFMTASDLAPLRITQVSSRPAGAENENFAVPSVAVDGDDIIHLAWTSIDSSIGATPTFKLYYGRYDPAQAQWLETGLYRWDTGGYYEPAKLIADPATGGVWLLYVDRATHANDEIYAEYRAAGAAAFDDRVRLTASSARQHYPDGLVDTEGVLKVVYVDEADDSIQLVNYDRATQALSEPEALTSEDMGNLYRPTLTQDERGSLYVVWENKIGVTDINLWFTTNRPPENAAGEWILYR